MDTPFTQELTTQQVLQYVQQGRDAWLPRWNVVKRWRDLRYMRDNVRSLIPDALRSTNFEYHDGTFNKACFELASFLSAAAPMFMVNPPSDNKREAAQAIQDVLHAVLAPGGVLDRESNNQVPFLVWENQGENGHGIYKLVLKSSYPLAMPQREYFDDPHPDLPYEDNPAYTPRSRKEDRKAKGESKLRETDDSLADRRDAYAHAEFPFQWMHTDGRVFFEFTQNGVPIAQGEITQRPATALNQYGLAALNNKTCGFIFLGDAQPKDSPNPSPALGYMVNFFELWTANHGYCGFISATVDAQKGHTIRFGETNDWTWVNPLQRLPYFPAYGLTSTEDDVAGKLHGLFDSLIVETPLLNYLETLHFNAGHRQQLPIYQPVQDPGYAGKQIPLNAEMQQAVTEDRIEEIDLPPGWRWEPINPGSEVSVMDQLKACRERVMNNALAAVLTGTSPGSADSGAKISLMLNAATRAMSPLVRNHEIPMSEMAETILETSRRLLLPLVVEQVSVDGSGTSIVKKLVLNPEDIITTKVTCSYKIELPVDQAARETRGMALIQSHNMSYETVAPQFFNIPDPVKEKIRIRMDLFDGPMNQIAFQQAAQQLAAYAPEIFKDIMGMITPPGPPEPTVNGGANGAYGGASAMAGGGGAALPTAVQAEGGPQVAQLAMHASGS